MAAFFTLLLGTSVAVLGYFGYYFSQAHFVSGTERLLDAEIAHLLESPDLQTRLSPAHPSYADGAQVALWVDADGHKKAGSLSALPKDVSVLEEGTVLFTLPETHILYAAKVHVMENGDRLLVGTDVTDIRRDYKIMQVLSIVSIVLMVIVILTSFMISTFVVSRTQRIAQTAKKIMDTGNLSQRIEIDSKWDDLSNMSLVLNAFLARLEQLVLGIQQVSDNIAHDLRTPLTRLRNHLDTLRKNPQVQNDAQAVKTCEALLGEADHLLGTFNALLRIARIETGKQKNNFGPLHLHQLLRDVLDLYEPVAEEKDISFQVDLKSVSMHGDRDLIFQAFANLVDNAIKFSPANGVIMLTLDRAAGEIRAAVADSGPGIAPQDREKVFERFFRAESSRHTAGNGLGLSLVAAVVSLHGGRIDLHDQQPGVRVEVIFPAA